MDSNNWTYLGDGLYARYDGWQIELRANDPNDTDCDTVYLEEQVFDELVKFGQRSFVTISE